MAIFIFILGSLLVAAGAGGLVLSLDLLPTDLGILYAGCGTMAVSAGVVTLAIGGLTRRIDALAAARSWRSGEPEHGEAPAHDFADRPAAAAEPATVEAEAATRAEPAAVDAAAASRVEPVFAAEVEPAFADAAPEAQAAFAAGAEIEPTALTDDEPVNENRAGHLPTMAAIERALGAPAAAPTLVGSYSAGGADYKIFSDGSIEAETESGAYRFASMDDFKAYLAGGRG